MTYWLLPFTFQIVLQSLVVALLGIPFYRKPFFRDGILVVQWRPWFDDRWPFATTIGYIIGMGEDVLDNAALWFHEAGVHVKQYEDMAVLSDIIASVVLIYGWAAGVKTWPLALGIWASGGPLWLLPFFLTALRHRGDAKELGWRLWETMYRFSWHEKDAYAETEQWVRNGGRLE